MAGPGSPTLIVVMPIGLGGLEVDAEVVEEHALGRLDAEQLAGRRVEQRLGLADADLARLDDDVEAGHHGGDLGPPALGLVVAADDVVGQAGRLVPGGPHLVERGDHLRAHLAGQQRQHVGAGHLVAERRRLLGERHVELGVVELGALQPGPRVDVGIGGVHRSDEVERDPPLPLVVPEGLEGAGEDDAAEVPQYRSDHGR